MTDGGLVEDVASSRERQMVPDRRTGGPIPHNRCTASERTETGRQTFALVPVFLKWDA